MKFKTSNLRRVLLGGLVVCLVLLSTFYLGAGWYFSGLLYRYGFSVAAKHAQKPSYPIRVVSIGKNIVTLEREFFVPAEAQNGVWGLQWQGGYGEVTTVISANLFTVTRAFHSFTGRLTANARVGLESFVYPLNPKIGLGLAYQNVFYRGPLGSYPAWFIPGRSSTWAISLHGNSLLRTDTMKIVPVLHANGLPVLVIKYRNDLGAPQGRSAMLGYGKTEWPDLQGAVRFAIDHGAKHVVLVGFSMGGSIAVSFMEHSPLANRVAGIILDSPMLNFSTTVDFGASQQRLPLIDTSLPPYLVDLAKVFATARYGIDWKALNYFPQISKIRCPILLFQGSADTTVPPSTSIELASQLGSQVTYVQTHGAGHIASWNVAPARYNHSVSTFLSEITLGHLSQINKKLKM